MTYTVYWNGRIHDVNGRWFPTADVADAVRIVKDGYAPYHHDQLRVEVRHSAGNCNTCRNTSARVR